MTLGVTPAQIVNEAERSGAPGLLACAAGWERVMLGAVARVVNGAAFSSQLFNADGRGMPLVRIRDVGKGRTNTWYDGPYEAVHEVRAGDILVGMDGDFRVARWRGSPGLLNQRVCRIDVNEDLYDGRFLMLALQGYLDAIWNATSSITVKHLSSRSITDIPLPRPPLDEQRRIVDTLESHLSRLEAADAGLRAADARLMRLVAASRLEALRTAMTAGVVPLKELAVRSDYGTSAKCVAAGPGPAVVRIPNLVAARIDLTDEKRVRDPELDVSARMLDEGDLLIVRTNGSRDLIGRTAVVQPGINAAFASYLIRYQLDTSSVRPEWVQLVMQAPSTRAQLESMAASSAGQYNLSLRKLDTLRLPIPPLAKQAQLLAGFSRVRSSVQRASGSAQDAGVRGKRLTHALLSAAFSGKLAT